MKKIAEEIIRKLGGAENIESMVHCTTRVKFKVKNDWTVDKNALEETDGVLGLFESNGYLQLIVKNAPDVYVEIADAAGVCKDPENSKESPSANRDPAKT